MEKIRNYLEAITNNEATLSDNQLSQFEQYFDMLVEKNKVMNLTAITEREDVILKHFIDSLALAGYVKLWEKPYRLLDVGTGAGFPGVPLKIAFPNLQVTLFDSLNKRIKFLQEVIDALDLSNTKLGMQTMNNNKDMNLIVTESCVAIHGRAEEGARKKEMRGQFDYVVSRAVANLAVLSEYCIPFVKQNGYFIPYKTETVKDEINQAKKAISILGGVYEKTEKLTLPDSDIGRSFVFIQKKKDTPKSYPRKAGTASKQPLGIS